MSRRSVIRPGFAWLELLLALAMVALVLQLFPPLLALANFRNWSRSTWFVVNTAVVLSLLTIRFGPDLFGDWRERRQRLATDREKAEHIETRKAHREAIERVKKSRRRRMY